MSLLHHGPTIAQTHVLAQQFLAGSRSFSDRNQRSVSTRIVHDTRVDAFAEATWGADPLEYLGGFRSLRYKPDATFRSSLPINGTARWNITEATQTTTGSASANISLSVSYSDVDWQFLKTVYGWASVQYQAWARGELVVHGDGPQSVVLHTDAILEYWVDDAHYFGGDYYTFRKAPPVLHLSPGTHRIDLRLVRDVRAFGGIVEPTIDVVLDIQKASGSLELAKPGILMSDVIDGKLATPSGSVSLRNSGEYDIEVLDIRPANVNTNVSSKSPFTKPDPVSQSFVARSAEPSDELPNSGNTSSVVVVAGQTRPVVFDLSPPSHNASSIAYNITYRTVDGSHYSSLEVFQNLNHVSAFSPHKITYLHPGGMLSYAMLRPPAKNASCQTNQKKAPIFLVLHGAGVEADNPMVTSAMDPGTELCAWVLYPTGVTSWSGDDWHNWGFSDVEAAIQAIPDWIDSANWRGVGVDTDRWIVIGHSNGGQGAWYTLSHRPDKVLAAAPVSGYSSIQKYVPYELWQPADPRRTAIISGSLNSYRHEMLMPNTRGIPIQQQHGEIDDNVPAYHSRFLAQQVHLAGATSSYSEIQDQNHWWDTIMTTSNLVDFYKMQAQNKDVLPRRLEEFSFVVGDPGDMGSKCGVKVTQLEEPGQYGKVHVKGNRLKTTNVLSIEFLPPFWNDSVIVDGEEFTLPEQGAKISLRSNNWVMGLLEGEETLNARTGRQLGSMTAILRTHGPFIIQHQGSAITSHVALQISRNLHQYLQADTVIMSHASSSRLSNSTGNVVTLVENAPLENAQPEFPIQVSKHGISIRDSKGRDRQYGKEARGAALLRPLDGERLELVIWGADNAGLAQAARVVPMLTGVGQPDFVVFGEAAKWAGIEGIVAMGFFDTNWQVTASSVLS
jgi:predicted esterase